ncbi:hypothetical protein [Deinococcus sp. Leaf326]|uniref:DUF7683 domain-containing protein n=1 Tax=Deinococcus sp. Leaf326 TaxID=1736338 RepID=UPI0006FBD86E|nr:hypothetical protein [Deinococcus sp. Leaf326]KQR15562.1 hypothetical protein ASF71_07905 [Deinococcus sp. Leaf326]
MKTPRPYVYALYEFDRHSERLERRFELPDCDPELVREQFAPDGTREPYIFDSFPVVSYRQALLLAPHLVTASLDFSQKDYFFESNQYSFEC